MKYLPARTWQAACAHAALLFVVSFLLTGPSAFGQTPYPLASGNYTENFDDLAAWTADFGAGTGASHFGKASPQPSLPNSNTVFSTGASGGVQKGTGEHLNKIVLLATGTTDGANAAAFNLHLDFSAATAGTISLDWATVFNSTGNRQATFKLQTNTGANGSFVDLAHPPVVLTNNLAASGTLSEVALPAAFNHHPGARIRFFLITSAGGSSGSRPKVSLDNIRVTATASTEPPTPPAASLTVAPAALSDFGFVAAGAVSAARSFTLSGLNLSGPVTVSPAPGFEIRTGTGAFACCPLVLTPQDGKLAATAIEVRFAPAAAGPQQGSIEVSSPGAPAQAVTLSGTGQPPVYPATLSTTALTNPSATGVSTVGTIASDGGSAVTERGVVWATAPSPDLHAGRLADATAGTGDFVTQVSGLQPNTTYFLRAYATNAAGTAFGEEWEFRTQACVLTRQAITGEKNQSLQRQHTAYHLSGSGASTFLWTLSGGGEIVAGQGTEAIQVNWTGRPGTHRLSVRYGQGPDCPSETASLDVALYDPSQVLAYPNPFVDKATIRFSLSQDQAYTVEVFDPLGHLVQHLQSGTALAGELVQVTWHPGATATGVYFVRLTSGKNTVRHLRLVWIEGR